MMQFRIQRRGISLSEKGAIVRKSIRFSIPTFVLVLAFLLLPLFPAVAVPMPAADEASVAGHWVGEVELPGTKLGFDVDLALKPDGTWSGDISIPMQNAKDLPLGNISVKGKDVSFEIAGVPGNPSLKGTLSDDGQKVTGQFMQGGQSFPCAMSRSAGLKAKAKQALAGFDAIVNKGLEGLKVPGVAVAIIVEDEVVPRQPGAVGHRVARCQSLGGKRVVKLEPGNIGAEGLVPVELPRIDERPQGEDRKGLGR